MKQQFDLSLWLQDKSRKVVTRDGREVRIICWDIDSNTPVLVAFRLRQDREEVFAYGTDGKSIVSLEYDLFFADDEELTELQKTLEEDCDCYVNLYNDGKTREELREWIKGWCPRIIDLARKEIQPEIDEKLKEEYDCGYSIGKFDAGEAKVKELVAEFEKGRTNALKDLPKWKDVSGKNGAGTKDYKIVGYYLVKGNYAIYLEDLEKLPKE